MKPTRVLPVALAVLLGASASAQFQDRSGRIPHTVVQSGAYSSMKNQGLVEIPNQTEFERYWSRVHRQPAASAPRNIDWFKHKLIAVHLGERPSGGFRIVVQGLEENRNGFTIRVVEQAPAPGSFVTQAITSPWVLIQVDNQLRNPVLSVMRADRKDGVFAPPPGHVRCDCRCGCPCYGG